MADPTRQLELLAEGTNRLVRTVDGFHGDDWEGATELPDWSRAHVVAHLALNAEGLAAALRGIVEGEPAPMYASNEARDGDIATLAGEETATIRERLLAGCTGFADAFAAVPEDDWGERIERTPGSPVSFAAATTVLMRLREVEIHHADLAAGYAAADWPMEFCLVLLDSMTKREWPEPFRVAPIDLDRAWTFGTKDGEGAGADDPRLPSITGPAAEIGWWLTGRPASERVSGSRGQLPKVGAW